MDSLEARLQALRQQNNGDEEGEEHDTFETPRPSEDPAIVRDVVASLESSPATSGRDPSLSVPVWHNTKEAESTSSYLDDAMLSRQFSYRRAMSRSVSPGKPTVKPPPTYAEAFKIVQQAVDAEKSGDPLFAMELYADAGAILVNVGKNESDDTLKKGIKAKAFELLRRAEQLDQWYQNVQEQAEMPENLPEQGIQRTEVPTVENSWGNSMPPFTNEPEFTHMRYTAVATKDPIQFTNDGYVLRCHEQQHSIRAFITITMYNEEGSELKATLTGIAQNVQYMSEQHGINYWESIAIAIVSDGRLKASESCLDYLTNLGAFDEQLMTVTSLGVDVHLHLFESSIQLVRDNNFESFYPPMQIIYALKEHNGGKLNSHLWFFNAFSEQILPTYTVLIDVGTIPGNDSIFRLIRSMDRNGQIGGVAGEIAVDKPNFFNPVIAAQHFEYKISNIMDKSLESVLGFISVLPGAFSAYRYEAIRAEKGVGPLPEYFKSLTTSTKDLGPFKGNMYLAEDRILCFELLARKRKQWTMHYVKDAIACTDVPETLVNLIKQRRRWLNGSFFAGLFAISNFGRVWAESSHGVGRKILLTFQFSYLMFQNMLSWLLLSNLYLTFYYVLTLQLHKDFEPLLTAILMIYLSLVGGMIIFALGNKPDKRAGVWYAVCSAYFGTIMMAVTAFTVYTLLVDADINDPRSDLKNCATSENEIRFGVIAALGFIFFSAIAHGEFGIFLSTIQYFFMLPTFVNVLGIYAYSNLHDLSWGTKGLESGGGHGPTGKQGKGDVKDVVAMKKKAEAARQKALQEKEDVDNSFRTFRSGLLLVWLVTNGTWIFCMTEFVSSSCYLRFLAIIVAVFNIIRFGGSMVFLLFRIARRFRLNCCVSRARKSNYSQQLPPEWQAHYQNQNRDESRTPQAPYRSV